MFKLLSKNWNSDFRIISEASQEIEEEIEFHIFEREQQLIDRGVAPELAKKKANEKFGNVFEIRRECLNGSGIKTLLDVRRVLQILGVAVVVAICVAGWLKFDDSWKKTPTALLPPEYLPTFGVKARGWDKVGFLVADRDKQNSPLVEELELAVFKESNVLLNKESPLVIPWRYSSSPELSAEPNLVADRYTIIAKPQLLLEGFATCGSLQFKKPIVGIELRSSKNSSLAMLDYISGWQSIPENCRLGLSVDRHVLGISLPLDYSGQLEIDVYVSAEHNIDLDLSKSDQVRSYLKTASSKEQLRVKQQLILMPPQPENTEQRKLREEIMEVLLSENLPPEASISDHALQIHAAHQKAHEYLFADKFQDVLDITEKFLPMATRNKESQPEALTALYLHRILALQQLNRSTEAKELSEARLKNLFISQPPSLPNYGAPIMREAIKDLRQE